MYRLMLLERFNGQEILINRDHIVSMEPSQVTHTTVRTVDGNEYLLKLPFADFKKRASTRCSKLKSRKISSMHSAPLPTTWA